MQNASDLPDDMDALKAMRAASLAELADRDAVIERKEDRIVRREKRLADFKRALFGHRSEKSDPDQFELALEDIETTIAAIHAEVDAGNPPKSGPAKPRNAERATDGVPGLIAARWRDWFILATSANQSAYHRRNA